MSRMKRVLPALLMLVLIASAAMALGGCTNPDTAKFSNYGVLTQGNLGISSNTSLVVDGAVASAEGSVTINVPGPGDTTGTVVASGGVEEKSAAAVAALAEVKTNCYDQALTLTPTYTYKDGYEGGTDYSNVWISTPAEATVKVGSKTFPQGTLPAGIYIANELGFMIGNGQTLTLDAQDDPNAVFVFIAKNLSSSTGNVSFGDNSTIKLINGAKAENVLWIAQKGISIRTGANVQGNMISGGDDDNVIQLSGSTTINGSIAALGDTSLGSAWTDPMLGGTGTVQNITVNRTPYPTAMPAAPPVAVMIINPTGSGNPTTPTPTPALPKTGIGPSGPDPMVVGLLLLGAVALVGFLGWRIYARRTNSPS